MVPWRWQLVETRVSEVSSRYLLVVRAVGLRREKSLRLSDMLLCWLGFAEVSAKVVDGFTSSKSQSCIAENPGARNALGPFRRLPLPKAPRLLYKLPGALPRQ